MTFIFVKRQIQRFTLRNRRGPHTHIGHGAPKPLRREADRLLDYVHYIRYEPKIYTNPALNPPNPPEHFYRAKAIERFHQLEQDIMAYSSNYTRLPGTNVRSYLLNCSNGPLLGVDNKELHQVCDAYEHARHHYAEFNQDSLDEFTCQLEKLHTALTANRANKPHPSPLPAGASSPSKRGAAGRRKRSHPNKPGATNFESVPMTVFRGAKEPAEVTTVAEDSGSRLQKAAAV